MWLENTHDIIKMWDGWGIPMKHDGKYEFAGHTIPGKPKIHLHYGGQGQKKILTKKAREQGVEIVNRVMIFDLLSHGGAISGALGVDTREKRVIEFQAKSVLIATGRCVRLYPAPVPGWMFNVAYSPCSTGDGMAIAYRAGAGLGNIEISNRWAGPRYLSRCGKASWVGVLRDPQDNPIGPFVSKPDRNHGDAVSDIYPALFADYAREARGPVYMDCRGISADDYEYMRYFMRHEGLTSLLNHMDEEGIDFRKNPVEFGTYEINPRGGIYHDDDGQTSIKGLFVAGDEAYSSSSISMASTCGWLIGEKAAHYAQNQNLPDLPEMQPQIEERVHFLDELLVRRDGPGWKEVNIALQQIMQDYASVKRTAHLLEAGLRYIRRLKEKTLQTVMAVNQHELMHCLEVLDLIEVGEALFVAADERKETRGLHQRPDFPFTNPVLDKFLIVKKVDVQPVTEWIDVER
jgi:succinate dehydrogenase/fumarate reductase flavoprotein subunit